MTISTDGVKLAEKIVILLDQTTKKLEGLLEVLDNQKLQPVLDKKQ